MEYILGDILGTGTVLVNIKKENRRKTVKNSQRVSPSPKTKKLKTTKNKKTPKIKLKLKLKLNLNFKNDKKRK